jgi:hypothetical protein
MCMTIASQSVSAWLQSQERMLRVWRDELLLGGADDQNQIERIDGHRRWLVEEMALLKERPSRRREPNRKSRCGSRCCAWRSGVFKAAVVPGALLASSKARCGARPHVGSVGPGVRPLDPAFKVPINAVAT